MNFRSHSNSADTGVQFGALIVLTLLLAGCGREDVKVYRLAKVVEPPVMAAQGGLPPGHPDTSGSGFASGGPTESARPQLTWKTPNGWTEVPPGQMRVASFKINADGKQGDVSIIPLEGVGGGDAANVNRWRGQVSLEPASEEQLRQAAQAIEAGGQPAQLHDVAGKSSSGVPTRILGVIQHRGGTAWFYKLTGDDSLVAEQKPAFIAFLKSLNFDGQKTGAQSPASDATSMPGMPAGHPEVSAPSAAGGISSDGKPSWQVPAGWTEVPGGQFLVAKFTVTGGAPTAVNVSMSSGDGGGLLPNVNRWRQQLGLAPMSETELATLATTVDIAGGKATFVELSGIDARSNQPSKLSGAMVPQAGRTWFYKLMGDPAVVAAQQDAFKKFVQTVKY